VVSSEAGRREEEEEVSFDASIKGEMMMN